MKRFIYCILLILPIMLLSQEELKGVIYEGNEKKAPIPLFGANVYWLNTTIGATTNEEGEFAIPYQKTYQKLVISYVGFKTDTLTITNANAIEHWLQPTNDLDAVALTSRKQTTRKSYLEAGNVLNISSDELLKAACCNLSESFETNPSIDVNFADAVTGTKQIKLLGLTSPYILIAVENIPSIRGASQAFGLSYIPGTWVESIQITKGAGSVINGFESFSGQINVELHKPSTSEPLFVNAYASGSGRFELNTHINRKVSDRWDTGLFIHGNLRESTFDRNDDSFLDVPLARQVNIMNRWQYTDTEHGIVSFINLRYLNDEKRSGQIDLNPSFATNVVLPNGIDFWESDIDTQRFEASAKLGYVNPELPYQSIGLQITYSHHDQESIFGIRPYDITHNSAYSNLIYSSILGDTRHKFKTGLSLTYDSYDETAIANEFSRTERSLGGFFEYTFDNLGDLNLTAGLRLDTHNLLGTFMTPRFHLRYTPWERSALKASFGRGKRSANIFAENQQLFATSRAINILDSGGEIFGLDPEIAWNYGMSFLQSFNLFGRAADVTFDFYRTDFQDQVVVDWENPFEVRFYNLEGDSFANSFQAELNYNLAERLDLRLAYKFYDVETAYISGELDRPLTPKNRVFANLAYETPLKSNNSRWKFDATFNWVGEQRFPSTQLSPIEFQQADFTPSVTTVNAQMTRVFSKTFEVYLGGENINNIRQDNPVVSNDNPFGQNFDTTFVYGPIFGSTYYIGLRLKIE